MAETAVRFFAVDDHRTPRTLAGKLQQLRFKLMQELGEGYATDFADYKHRAGKIEGLKLAIEECEAVEKEMNE